MTKADAHIVLNAARAGWPVPQHTINEALIATGDIDPDDGPSIVWKPAGTWEGTVSRAPARWTDVVA